MKSKPANQKSEYRSKEMEFRMARALLLSAVLVSFVAASDPVPAPKQKKIIALIGGTIHTVSGGEIANGTIVFDKGKITAIAADAVIPPNAERINTTGKHVYPGLINAFSDLGLIEIPLGAPGTMDLEEVGRINPNVRAEVAVNPESELIPVARSAGITLSGTAPAGGTISGLAAAMMTDGWTSEDMTLKKAIGLVVNWPSMLWRPNPRSRQSKEDWMKERDGQVKLLRDAFANARAYRKAKISEDQKGIPYHDTDERWEAMIPVLEGVVPVFVVANELTQIQAAISWVGQEGIRMVLVGGRDSWRVAHQLKEKNIPVILQGTHSLAARRSEAYDLPLTLPKKLFDAGVRFCIAGQAGEDNASNSRHIPHHAASAAAFGLSKNEALRSITLSAAEILGVAEKVGSLEIGKDATLIVTNGDPLELSTSVEQVFIQGRKCDMRDKHKQLYEKYVEKYKQLETEKRK